MRGWASVQSIQRSNEGASEWNSAGPRQRDRLCLPRKRSGRAHRAPAAL